MENLSSQLTELIKHLPANSPVRQKITTTLGALEDIALETPIKIKHLFSLYEYINHEERLKKEFHQSKKRLQVEQINVTILLLIKNSLASHYKRPVKKDVIKENYKNPLIRRIILFFIGLLTVFLAAWEGGSIAQTIFTSLGHIPNFVLIPAQILFAIGAASIFILFELNSYAKPLDLRLIHLGAIFKFYIRQALFFEEISKLLLSVANQKTFDAEGNELNTFEEMLNHLNSTYSIFNKKVEAAEQIQKNSSRFRKVIQIVGNIIVATILGSIATLLAQSYMPYLLPLIVGPAIASGPIGFGIMIGVMAICFAVSVFSYFHLRKNKTINEFVGNLYGAPSKAIKQLLSLKDSVENTKDDIKSACDKNRILIDAIARRGTNNATIETEQVQETAIKNNRAASPQPQGRSCKEPNTHTLCKKKEDVAGKGKRSIYPYYKKHSIFKGRGPSKEANIKQKKRLVRRWGLEPKRESKERTDTNLDAAPRGENRSAHQ